MPHPLSGQSVEEATAVEGMASRRTVRVVEIAELLGVTQARAHQIAPFKARGDLGATGRWSERVSEASRILHDTGARAYQRLVARRAADQIPRPPRGRVEGLAEHSVMARVFSNVCSLATRVPMKAA
jgi:hypothetical protein